MPDQPNWQEFGLAVVGKETEPNEVYKARYGDYQDHQGTHQSSGAKPIAQQTPFKLGSGA